MLEVIVVVQQFSANNQNSEVDSDAKTIANLYETIKGYQKDIVDLEANKSEVIHRMRSLVLRWLESIGIKRDNLKNIEHIKAVDIKLLSTDDLKRKLKYYEDSQMLTHVLITKLQSQIENIKDNAKERTTEAALAKQDLITQSYVEQYKNAPIAFFATITADEIDNITADDRALYKRADQIVATCEWFDEKIDRRHLWLAWKVLDRVREAEQRLNPKGYVYTDGAEKLLKVLCNIDNRLGNISGLELLFKSKNYEKVNSYLHQIFQQDVVSDPEHHKQLLEQLKQDVVAMSNQKGSVKKQKRN